MKKKIIAIFFVCLMLSGCNIMSNDSETVVLYGKTQWEFDNTYIEAQNGYFTNAYEWVEIDEHTKQLIITLKDNKEYGEK